MIPFSALVAVIGFSLSLFLVTTFKGFDNYHQVQRVTRSYDTSSLAAASRLARSGSNLLAGLSSSLASENASSTTEINNRYQLLQNYLSEIDIAPSASPSALLDTISRGLVYGSSKTLHNSYSVDLVQSNYIPAQTSSTQPRYAQTLVSDEHIAKIINPIQLRSDLDAGANRLRISSTMLGALVSDASAIIANPSVYGIEISDRGVDLNTIPNAARINWQIPVANLDIDPARAQTTEIKQIHKQAVAQIRFNGTTTVVAAVPPVILPPVTPPTTTSNPTYGGPCNSSWQWNALTGNCEQAGISLVLQAIPYDRIAVVYDPNKAIDSSNPIEIINKKMGGMNSIYKETNGDLQISIGAVPTKANGIANSNTKIDDLLANSQVSATLYALNDDEKLPSGFAYTSSGTITLDTLPRSRTRYGTVTTQFTHNSITIPKDSVIVAVRQTGLIETGRPSAKEGEFESYAIYDKSGVYLAKFGTQFGIDHNQKLQFNYTAPASTNESLRFGDYKVYQEFETDDLFKGLDSKAALSAWLNMQSDMSQRTQFDIVSKKNTWATNIFKQILDKDSVISSTTKEEVAYITNVIEYQGADQLIKDLFPDMKFVDEKAKTLYQEQIKAMTAYAVEILNKAKVDNDIVVVAHVYVPGSKSVTTYGEPQELSSKSAQSNKDITKKAFQEALDAFTKYNESATKANNTTVSKNSGSTTSSSASSTSTTKPATITATSNSSTSTAKPATTTSPSSTTTVVKNTKPETPATLNGGLSGNSSGNKNNGNKKK